MDEVDRALLDGRPQRVVHLPTASAPEGAERVAYWVDLGREHFTALGVEFDALPVLERTDADDDELAARVAGAGLIYLSGGNPAYLTETLRDSVVWRAIVDAFDAGAALAGCSAGAIALSAVVRDRFSAGAKLRPALGIVGNLAVLPHFDRLQRFRPDLATSMAARLPTDVTLVGVDEDTAIAGGPDRWQVFGKGSAWVYRGEAQRYSAGETFKVEPHNTGINPSDTSAK